MEHGEILPSLCFSHPASKALYGYSNSRQYFKDVSFFEPHDLTVPTLIVQPRDDPLHGKHIDENIDVEKVVGNQNIVYYSPTYGNHFGTYISSMVYSLIIESNQNILITCMYFNN